MAAISAINRHARLAFTDKILLSIIAVFLIIKIWLMLGTGLLDDEAYYWVWGQRLQLSYFDHPALGAWLMGAMSFIFGDGLLGARMGAVFSFTGTSYFLWRIACELRPEASLRAFLIAELAFLASPTLFAWSTIVYFDHLLIFLCLGAMFYYARFLSSDHDIKAQILSLYLAVIYLGLAGLAKYSALFVGLAFAATILCTPKYWKHLKNPHLYFAALLCVAMQVPTFYWNWMNDFSSFGFHLYGRHSGPWWQSYAAHFFVRYFLYTFILFGPFLLFSLLNVKSVLKGNAYTRTFGRLALFVSGVTMAFLLSMVMTVSSHWYWTNLAYLGIVALAPILFQLNWIFWAHIGVGLIGAVLVTINYSVIPLAAIFGIHDVETSKTYDWHKVVSAIERLETEKQTDFVATSRFKTVAQLGFHAHRQDIWEISPVFSQFDYWQDLNLLSGKGGLILGDEQANIDNLNGEFESLTLLEEVVIERLGYELYRYQIYYGQNFMPLKTQVIQ